MPPSPSTAPACMTDAVLALIAAYGVAMLFAVTWASCLALPVPSSLMMLAAGGFSASGDMVLWQVVLAAFAGAVAGDVAGYGIGRAGGAWLGGWIAARPGRAGLRARADALIGRWGGPGIFFSRWLFSPLGPYVNFATGLGRYDLRRFVFWVVPGEAIWVMLYVGLGYVFADRISALADVLGNASGFLAMAAVSLGLGLVLWRKAGRRERAD